MRLLLLAAGLLGVAAAPAGAVDYATVDRALKKEPAYQSKAPKYALLLFGREAKLRVWAVLDGETLYLDRNGDGDLTGEGERFARVRDVRNVVVRGTDSDARYILKAVQTVTDSKTGQTGLMVNVTVQSAAWFRQYGDAAMHADPNKAAVSHFDGPLSAGPRTVSWKLPKWSRFEAGGKQPDIHCAVGTMDAAHGCWVVLDVDSRGEMCFAPGVRPVAEVEFPAEPGRPVVKRRYTLDKLC